MEEVSFLAALRPKISLYFHIPFCLSKCSYCAFNSYVGMVWLIPRYVLALEREIYLWLATTPELRGWEIKSLYFGGGTPSLLTIKQLSHILKICSRVLNLASDCEITLEANPGTVGDSFLSRLFSLGVNRLSLGIQSFSDRHLKQIGRLHSASEARLAYKLAREAGFDNVNIDLLYGLPLQSIQEWRETLDQVLELMPEHLSLYCLTVEDNTALAQTIASGKLPEPDPDLAAEMYFLAEEKLAEAGYTGYEISNWAKPGKECRHNLTYWKNQTYLGLGAGAHSYLRQFRWANFASPLIYVELLEKGKPSSIPQGFSDEIPYIQWWQELIARGSPVASLEYIDQAKEIMETIILGLRLKEGINLGEFYQRFNLELTSLFGKKIDELIDLGLVIKNRESVCLTSRGKLLGNEIFWRFLPAQATSSRESSLPSE